MSDPDGDELLAKVRGGKAKEKVTPTLNPEDFYTKIVVNKQRRSLLIFGTSAYTIFAYVVLARELLTDHPWMVSALPLMGAGLILGLLPPTEAWEYKPWQTRARQYEKHQAER